jgi:hypothetical protein
LAIIALISAGDHVSPAGSDEVRAVVGEDDMDLAGDGLNQAAQKVCGRLAHHLLVQFDESELRGPVDRDDEIELSAMSIWK